MILPGVRGKNSIVLINNEGGGELGFYISVLKIDDESWMIYTKKKSLMSKEFKTQIFIQEDRDLIKFGEVHYLSKLNKSGFSYGFHEDVVTHLFKFGEMGYKYAKSVYCTLAKMKELVSDTDVEGKPLGVAKVLIFPMGYPVFGKVGYDDIEKFKEDYVDW